MIHHSDEQLADRVGDRCERAPRAGIYGTAARPDPQRAGLVAHDRPDIGPAVVGVEHLPASADPAVEVVGGDPDLAIHDGEHPDGRIERAGLGNWL